MICRSTSTISREVSRTPIALFKVEGKNTASVVGALKRRIQSLPEGVMRSLTWDRGPEMAQHKQITLATKVDIYICDPPSTLSGSCFA
jgi:IS30 family transposase